MRNFILLSVLLASPLSFAAKESLPADAKKLLDSLPKKAVTLDVVLDRAVKASDSFEALQSESQLIEVPRMRAEALTQTTLKSSGNYSDNKNEPLNSFSFERQNITQYTLGAETRFQTGTSLKAELSHGKYIFTLPPLAGGRTSEIYQSVATLSLSQSLLKDSFGYATRKKIQAAELTTQSRQSEYENKIQNWSLNLAQVFFEAWMSKENYNASLDSLERRNKTLNVTRIRSQRGTSEKPDLLQALSAQRDAELALKDAHLDLVDKWRALVISLKLPESWVEIDPVLIPLELEDETSPAKQACSKFKENQKPLPSPTIKSLEAMTKASELQLKASKNAKLPQLELVGSYSVNGVDEANRSDSFRDVSDTKFPAWSVGLQVSYPLDSPLEESDRREAAVNQIKASRSLQESKDQLQLTWMSLCERLETLDNKVSEYKLSVSQQSERERLESRRFNIGRVPLINVIQSGDDQTRARLNLLQSQAQLQLTALQVLTLNNAIYQRISGYIQ